jgi:hypothetical protein
VETDTAALEKIVKKLTDDFKQTPDYKVAEKAVQDASAAFDLAKAPVIAALPGSSPAYKQAKTQQAIVQKKYNSLKDSDPSSPTLLALGQQIFDIGNAMGPIEEGAVEDDPACMVAKKKLDATIAAVTKLMDDFKVSLKQNADWIAANAALTDAQTRLAALTPSKTPGATPTAASPGAGGGATPPTPAAQ